MEIDAQDVIEKLLDQLREAARQRAMLEAVTNRLQRRIDELENKEDQS